MGTGGACLLPHLVVVAGGKRLTLTQRRRTSKTHSIAGLDDESLAQLKDYFGRLCTDDTYANASPIAIGSNINIPEIAEHEFWNVLSEKLSSRSHSILDLQGTQRKYSHLSSQGFGIFLSPRSRGLGPGKRLTSTLYPKLKFLKRTVNIEE